MDAYISKYIIFLNSNLPNILYAEFKIDDASVLGCTLVGFDEQVSGAI